MNRAGQKQSWDKLDIPSRFDDIEQWCREGVIERDICTNLGIGVTMFNRWKTEHPEIKEVLKRGKSISDQIVVSKLYARAVGYEYDEVKRETVQDAKGNELNVFRVTTIRKHVLPDVTACIFWTKNRMPDEWRDKHEVALDEPTRITEARQRVEEKMERLLAGLGDSKNGRDVERPSRLGARPKK